MIKRTESTSILKGEKDLKKKKNRIKKKINIGHPGFS